MDYLDFEEQQPVEPPLTGYAIHRGMLKLMTLFSASFCLTILARLFPGMQSALWILAATSIFGFISHLFIKKGDQSLQLILIAVALLGGVVGGSWDAIAQMEADPMQIAPAFGLVALLVAGFFAERALTKKTREGKQGGF